MKKFKTSNTLYAWLGVKNGIIYVHIRGGTYNSVRNKMIWVQTIKFGIFDTLVQEDLK